MNKVAAATSPCPPAVMDARSQSTHRHQQRPDCDRYDNPPCSDRRRRSHSDNRYSGNGNEVTVEEAELLRSLERLDDKLYHRGPSNTNSSGNNHRPQPEPPAVRAGTHSRRPRISSEPDRSSHRRQHQQHNREVSFPAPTSPYNDRYHHPSNEVASSPTPPARQLYYSYNHPPPPLSAGAKGGGAFGAILRRPRLRQGYTNLQY